MAESDEPFFVRLVAHGFFYPPDQFPEELIDTNGFHHVPLSGSKAPVQFFLVATWSPETEPLLYILLVAHFPRLASADIALLRALLDRHYPGRPALFSLEMRTGFARVDAPPEQSGLAGAAAVAASMASGSWDESDPIVIRFEDLFFAVHLTFQGKDWRAQVEPWLDGLP